jgi:methanogenic corrinoid protein MtbC1
MAATRERHAMTGDDSTNGGLRALLVERIAAHDKPGAVAAALSAVERGEIGVPGLYAMLSGLMAELGVSWQEGRTPVWEEHLVSGVMRTIVEALYPTVRAQADAAKRRGLTVVLACPQDESHDLGLRMLCDRFDLAGWDTHLLGADTPAGEIAAAAETLSAGLIVLSASTHFHRVRIRTLLDGLHAALPDVRVVVGGAAFTLDCCGLEDDEIMLPEEFLAVAGTDPDGTES